MEKLDIVKSLGEIQTELVRLNGMMAESNRTISEHHMTLYGNNGDPGIDKTVDRLNEIQKGRTIREVAVYVSIAGLFIERVWKVFTGAGN